MTYAERKSLFEQIEKIRNRPLITYVTSTRLNLSSNMALDAIPLKRQGELDPLDTLISHRRRHGKVLGYF